MKRVFLTLFMLLPLLLLAATLNLQVAAGNDDGVQLANTNVNLTSDDLIRPYANNTRWAAAHFKSTTLPQGATIDAATVQLYVESGSGGDIDLTIFAEDADSPANLAASSNNISNRTRTSASVEWDVSSASAGAWQTSPAINTIIQELADRGSFGGDIMIIWQINSGQDASIDSYDESSSLAPKLDITYTVGGSTRRFVIVN